MHSVHYDVSLISSFKNPLYFHDCMIVSCLWPWNSLFCYGNWINMERNCIVNVWSVSAFLQHATFIALLHSGFSSPHPPQHDGPLPSLCLPAVNQTGTQSCSLQPICPNPAYSGGALTSPFSQLSYRLLRTSALSFWIRGTRVCPSVGCSYGPLKGITHFDV